MKKIILIVLLLFPIKVYALSAETIVVMDPSCNRVLLNKNMHKQKYIASITKIMTALITIENGNLNDIVKIDESILRSYGSSVYLSVGEKISLKNLLYGLMLRSGNDAATAIASYIGGSMEGFTKLMNEKALEIGMKNTLFVNSSGLEENSSKANLSTAYDMALLTSEAMKHKEYRKIVKTKNITVKSDIKSYTWKNKNKLLFQYKYTTGGKTGYTKKANRTLVTTATKDGKSLIIVTLNDGNDFKDHKDLYTSYFNVYDKYKIVDKDEIYKYDYYKDKVIYVKKDFNMLLKDNEVDGVYKKLKIEKKDSFYDTEKIGYLEIYLNDKFITKLEVYIKDKKDYENSLSKKIKDILW